MSAVSGRRLTPSQIASLEAIPDKEDLSIEHCAKIPAAKYIDPARFELEKERLFKKAPMLIGASFQLPRIGMYFQVKILDTPILVTRAKDGKARAFFNVCRHRGTQLCAANQSMEGSRISCPYHAWTYSLEGGLIGVPREDAFPALDKTKYGLIELPCYEGGGLIWAGLVPGAKVDFSDVSGELVDELHAMGMDEMHVYNSKTYPLKANWKLVMDTMLDKYHVLRLHRNTLAKYFDDTPEITDLIGPHIRSTSRRANRGPEALDYSFEGVRSTTVFGYALFPAGMIVASPLYVSFLILRPISVDRTDADYYMLSSGPVTDEKLQGKLKRSFELMDIAFGQEDFWAAEQCHIGLASGAVSELLVGGLEKRMEVYHDLLEKRLGLT
jgi:phenylpropionate dioxygenase-like ring-hydroxylating dioxygenase large terminal subunit